MNFFSSLIAGAERTYAQNILKLTSGQIDAIEGLKERYPETENLDLRPVLEDERYRDLRTDVLAMLEDEDLANEFGRQIQADPTLADRINHLIARDPQKLRESVAAFRENPEGLTDTLKGLVSDQQAQEQATLAAAAPDGNMMAGLQEMLEKFSSMGMGDILNMLAGFLLSLFEGRNALIDNFGTALQNFAQSPEVVTAGNSSQPGGMLDQMTGMMNNLLGQAPDTLREGVNGIIEKFDPSAAPAPVAEASAAPAPINMVRPEPSGMRR